MTDLDKATLIEASYRINKKILAKIPRTKTSDYIKGYSKASRIAYNVMKDMIEEAK